MNVTRDSSEGRVSSVEMSKQDTMDVDVRRFQESIANVVASKTDTFQDVEALTKRFAFEKRDDAKRRPRRAPRRRRVSREVLDDECARLRRQINGESVIAQMLASECETLFKSNTEMTQIVRELRETNKKSKEREEEMNREIAKLKAALIEQKAAVDRLNCEDRENENDESSSYVFPEDSSSSDKSFASAYVFPRDDESDDTDSDTSSQRTSTPPVFRERRRAYSADSEFSIEENVPSAGKLAFMAATASTPVRRPSR